VITGSELPQRRVLAPGLSYFDLTFLGIPRAQAAAVLNTPGSVAIVDPGPTTCLDSLEQALQTLGLQLRDVTDLLLTHIHLDHSGAAGTIVRRHPHVRVHVHERGAEHLVRPDKLIDSARRFFGAENMERYWGDIARVPEDRLVLLRGGERVEAGGRTLDVAYTPGHAWHHVSYFDAASGIAFIGDTGGLCVNDGYVLPPTPPPDVDLEAWSDSVDRILAWHPRTLFATHFGPLEPTEVRLQELLSNLRWMAGLVKASLDEPGTDEERSQRLGALLRQEIQRCNGGAPTSPYEPTTPLDALWYGLARYWRKRR
jgi:glyoxylase-like metal-dependent hydrolase (beta-lactamase superfamily II)